MKTWPTFHYLSRIYLTKSYFAIVFIIFILYALGIRLIQSTVLPRNPIQATLATFQMVGSSFLTLLSMICILLPFLIIYSQIFHQAISNGSYMVWIRLKSMTSWIVCFLLSVLVFTIVFLVIGYFLAYAVHFLFPVDNVGYEAYFNGSILKQFVLYAGSIVILVFINFALIILFENTEIALLISLVIVMASSVVHTMLSVPASYFPILYGFYSNKVDLSSALLVTVIVIALLFFSIFTLFQKKFETLLIR